MQLLVIRHAPAGDPREFARTGANDDLRPITPEGRESMRSAALGLARIVPRIDALITSPLVRARQTAEIVAEAFGQVEIASSELLEPDARVADLPQLVEAIEEDGCIAIVGHRPHLHRLVGWSIAGRKRGIVRIPKGAAVLLDFGGDRDVGKERAKLVWAMPPRILAAIGLCSEPGT